jgi:hypothetical protein
MPIGSQRTLLIVVYIHIHIDRPLGGRVAMQLQRYECANTHPRILFNYLLSTNIVFAYLNLCIAICCIHKHV